MRAPERASLREDRREAVRVGVGGVDLSLVIHRRGERQSLAARARAKVEDLHAGLGFGEERGELRALVLQLDEPLDIGRVGGERRRTPIRAHGDAQAHRRERRRLGLEMGERAERLVATGLETIHAQIDRRAFGERPALLGRRRAEARLQLRREPFGEIPHHMRGRACERSAAASRSRSASVSFAGAWPSPENKAAIASASRFWVCLSAPSISARGPGFAHDPGGRAFLTQRIVDEARYRGAIARARKAVR